MLLFRNIDWKLAIVFISLVLLSIGYVSNQEAVKMAIKALLEWPHLNITFWLFVTISFLIHYLSVRKNSSSYESLIYKAFGKFADSAFAAITHGLATTTSAAILKGVYSQQIMEGEIYFNHFGEVDIYSMLVVCLFLLGYSLYASVLALKSAIYRSTSINAVPSE